VIAHTHMPIHRSWNGEPCEVKERANIRLQRAPDGSIRVCTEAPFHGDPPPTGQPGPTWALWEYEVVELFLLGDHERYLELEIGPHGHYLALLLEGRRTIKQKLLPLDVSVRRQDGLWTAETKIPASFVPTGALRGNAYAIHGEGDQRRYLAWIPVPGEAPDFHRLDCFVPVLPIQGL